MTSDSSYISAEELDLQTFFGVEPKPLDANIPWPYNDFLYEVQVGEISLSFAVAPAYKDVRVVLRRSSEILYELNAVGVQDVKYHNDSGRESLELVVSARENLIVRIAPRIQLTHMLSPQ